MDKNKWHIVRDEDVLTLSRAVPARLDIAVSEQICAGGRLSRGRLAQQVRQDMWRALQDLRGFSPVVQVREIKGGVEVTAGGSIDGVFPRAKSEATLSDLLSNPVNQARWLRFAARPVDAGNMQE